MARNTLTYYFRGVGGPLLGTLRGLGSTLQGTFALGQASVGGLVGAMHKLNGAVELTQKLLMPVKMGLNQLSDALNMAGDMESTEVAVSTMLGSLSDAKKLLGDVKAMAAETPFEFPELANSTKLLLAFGEAAGEVPATLRRLGDVASGLQIPMGDLVEIYGKARTQNVLFTEDLNQLVGRGIPALDGLAKVLGVGSDQIRKMAEDGQLTFPLLDQMFRDLTGSGGKFNGMMDKQSQTWNGLKSTLSDGWKELQTLFGTPIIKELKPVLQDAIAYLGTLKDEAEAIGKAIGQWAGAMRVAFMAGNGMDTIKNQLELAFTHGLNVLLAGLENLGAKIAHELEKGMLKGLSVLPDSYGGKKAQQMLGTMGNAPTPNGMADVMKGESGPLAERLFVLRQFAKANEAIGREALAAEQAQKALHEEMQNLGVKGNLAPKKPGLKAFGESHFGNHMTTMETTIGKEFAKPEMAKGLTKALELAAEEGKKNAKKGGEETAVGFLEGMTLMIMSGTGKLMDKVKGQMDAAKEAADKAAERRQLRTDMAKAKRALSDAAKSALSAHNDEFTAGGRRHSGHANRLAAQERREARETRKELKREIRKPGSMLEKQSKDPTVLLSQALRALNDINKKTKEVKVF
jgi:tape measure domain-containing protein